MAVPRTAPHKLKRRDAEMEKGNIVKTYQLGNATVHICDDFIVKTPEEVETILEALHAVGWAIFEAAAARGEEV